MKSNQSGFTGNTITSFLKYFSEEREVYIQNMGSTQISLSFGSGDNAFHTTIPKTRKPYILTQYVPFESIKNSFDFRKILSRRNPPILRLLTEEEYFSYYENLSNRKGTSIEDELASAQSVMDNLISKPKVASEQAQREMETRLEERIEKLETPIEPHPAVVGLCARADKEQGGNRISADDFMDDLEALDNELNEEDWEFISTKGVYKSIKKYAASRLEALVITEEDDED